MVRFFRFLVLPLLFALPLSAQQGGADALTQAQQVVTAAETAGAATHAKSLLADAQWRLRFAQENWNAQRRAQRDQARLRADEALWAGRAAFAKAQWLSTNAAIRDLQADITRLGGSTEISLVDEPATIEIDRPSSRSRINLAQMAIDQARAAGAEEIRSGDLKLAQTNVDTARKIVRGDTQSESADHLTYVAEMIARRAYYLARAAESARLIPSLQVERTRLAQERAEQEAEAERLRREEVQRQATTLQQQLADEQAGRQSQTAEIEQLRRQVEENRRMMEQRVEQDRAAREEAERKLDEAIIKYQSALATATTAEAENLRRQVEDQQFMLRAMQERERLNEQTMSAEIERLRTELNAVRQQGSASEQLLAERQVELQRREEEFQRLRREREVDLARRAEMERQQQNAIAEAQRHRQEAEAQAQQLAQEMEQARQQAKETQAQLEEAKRQTERAQAELQQARQQIAERDAEARRLRLQQELARVAKTSSDQRGFIVTLPGIFFDSGKSELKAGARNTLTKIVEPLRADDTVRIAVEGHTDDVGSDESNQELSEKRANAVRDFLVSAGIPADRITSAGRGETTPVATNRTASGRQQNRRVELVITNQ